MFSILSMLFRLRAIGLSIAIACIVFFASVRHISDGLDNLSTNHTFDKHGKQATATILHWHARKDENTLAPSDFYLDAEFETETGQHIVGVIDVPDDVGKQVKAGSRAEVLVQYRNDSPTDVRMANYARPVWINLIGGILMCLVWIKLCLWAISSWRNRE